MEGRSPVQLVVSGDDRPAANRTCWPAQHAMEEKLTADLARKPKFQKPALQARWRTELAELNARLQALSDQ